MIIGDNRKAVIENIKTFAENGRFHNKVELLLTLEKFLSLWSSYMHCHKWEYIENRLIDILTL